MYAIVANGSKQYKAEVGQVIKFEKLSANVGDKVEFEVVMVSDEKGIKVGKDANDFKVVGEVVEQGKDKKIIVFKYKAKKNERKKQGHRQPFTKVKVLEIVSKKAQAKVAKAEEGEKAVEESAPKAEKKAPAKKTVKAAE